MDDLKDLSRGAIPHLSIASREQLLFETADGLQGDSQKKPLAA
jgi:hypothetical protein